MSATTEQFHTLVHGVVDDLTRVRRTWAEFVAVDPDEVVGACGRAAAGTWTSERWRWRGHEALGWWRAT